MERSKARDRSRVADRARVGVIGCGLIAQVMHLPYLVELSDCFQVAAICDLREGVAAGCAARYGVPHVYSRWQDLLNEPLDAVVIATSGDHSPIAIAAAGKGLHVLVEKPMALCSRDARAMVQAAHGAGVQLVVGTMKRYDTAYERLSQLMAEVDDLRLIRVTTLESPFAPYVAHYPLIDGIQQGGDRESAAAQDPQGDVLTAAIGQADEETRWCYRWILLDNLVHEFNALRGLLGEPTEIRSADLSRACVSVNLRFTNVDCHLSWVDLPGIARYKQEFAFYAPDRRLTLSLPSPFLRSMPSTLVVEGGEPGTANSWVREELVSYDEAFKRELIEFSDCIRTGREPRTSGRDALGDIRLCESVARANLGGPASRRAVPADDTAAGNGVVPAGVRGRS